MACIFCQIVAGEIPSRTVYEEGSVLAFLDVNPLGRGHTLVIPKPHHERLNDLPTDLASAFYDTIQRLVPAVEDAVDAQASNVAVNNGSAAGQEVTHVHAHIIPRFPGDHGGPIHAAFTDPPAVEDAELDAIADQITTALKD